MATSMISIGSIMTEWNSRLQYRLLDASIKRIMTLSP